MSAADAPDAIAIIGMAGRFPGARDIEQFWQLLDEGRAATRWLDEEQLRAAGASAQDLADPDYVRASLPLDDMACFDAAFFGLSQRDAQVMDPQHRHFLECAWLALEHAGHRPERFEGAIGVFGGCGLQAYLAMHLLGHPQLLQSMGLFLLRHTGNDKDFLTTRVSYLLDLRGPSLGIQTACSTSLVAVHVACQSLLAGECDMALAGAASIELPHGLGYRHVPGEILSADGRCRAFDDAASGTLFGSGAGLVVLRRLADALRDGDCVHAVIRASAVNNDGRRKAGYLAPSVDGQAQAAAEALAVAGLAGSEIDYIEAHGTGTPVGDPIEVAALAQAYAGAPPGSIGLGSVKTNIGHLDTAAGVAGLVKVCLALRHERLPASLHFERLNHRLDMPGLPFQVVAQGRAWPRAQRVRRAAVNALGVGGTNAHLIVEEAPPRPDTCPQVDWQLVPLSARTDAALQALQASWRSFTARPLQPSALADIAWTAQEGRRPHPYRLAFVARAPQDLHEALQAPWPPAVHGVAEGLPPPVVWMFPGGGAQFAGAGRGLMVFDAFQEAVQACRDCLPPAVEQELSQVLLEAPDAAQAASWLERPAAALPALFIVEYALARLWQSWGVEPAAVIGHSAGEQAAACIAGLLSLSDAISLVLERARLFESLPAGVMASIDLPEQRLRPLLAGLALDIAAVNAPNLCLVSGTSQALSLLLPRLQQEGAEHRLLRLQVAAHSRVLEPVMASLADHVASMRPQPASLPFMSCVTGQWVRPGQTLGPDYWVRHLREPVQFMQALSRLRQELPQALLLEVGPGQGLGMLARSNGAGPSRYILPSTSRSADDGEDLPVMLASAGALWCRGIELEWAQVRAGGLAQRVALPTYPFERVRHWIDAPLREPQPDEGTGEARGPGAAASPALQRLPQIADWIRARAWQLQPRAGEDGAAPRAHAASRTAPPAAVGQVGGAWLVLGAASGLIDALRRDLPAQGPSVLWIEPGAHERVIGPGHWQLPWRDAGAWERLFDTLRRDRAWPQVLVQDVCALDASLDAAVTACCDVPAALAQALQGLDLQQPLRCLMVSRGAQRVLAGDRTQPWASLSLGACGAIAPECPGLSIRLVDLDRAAGDPGEDARCLLLESLIGEDIPGVPSAWRRGQRWLLQDAAPQPALDALCLRPGAVCLITGALGGIGLTLAQWLARALGARLALVGRRCLPPAAQWRACLAAAPHGPQAGLLRRLLALQEAGAQVEAFAADAADAGRMAEVLRACEQRWGPVQAVFHAAGEVEDQVLARRTPAATRRVIGGKAGGAIVLDRLLPQPLQAFVVFSSTSLELGLPGQLDYIAANAAAESVALARADGRVVRWGAWRDVGMLARAAGDAGQADHDLGAGEAAGPVHPLLGQRRVSDEATVFTSRYDASALWVLAQHRIAGCPVLPGAAVLEIARAAWTALGEPPQALTVTQLRFERALACATAREVEVRLRRADAGWHLELRSRAQGATSWVSHASADLREGPPSAPVTAPPGADIHDTQALDKPAGSLGGATSGATSGAVGDNGVPWQAGRPAQAGHPALDFGPRWQCLRRQRRLGALAEAELALDDRFLVDLSTFTLHPALVDMGMTIGLPELDAPAPREALWVPVAMSRVDLRAAPASVLRACARARDAGGLDPATDRIFDVELSTPQGQAVASIQGLHMRRVPLRAVLPSRADPAQDAGWMGQLRRTGICAADAPELFDRLLRSRDPLLVISPVELHQLRSFIQAGLGCPSRVPTPPPASLRAQDSFAAGHAPARSLGAAGTAASLPPTAARSETEAVLATHWRELLGVERISPDDDFFQLGGHSLIAVRLFARIRRHFGVELPLSTLFDAPTLAGLARRIEQKLPVARTAAAASAQASAPASCVPVAAPPASAIAASSPAEPVAVPLSGVEPARGDRPWSPLVEIARGDPARRPLFCVHGAGGNVLNFKLIADRLPVAQGLYGLQAQGVDGRQPPLDSIESMAAQYVSALRQAQPWGPYRLVGYSAGGLIAFEMAQQLQAQGERIELLAMIDTLAPHATRARIPWARKLWLARHWSPAFVWGWRDRRARGRAMAQRYAQARELLARGETLTPELIDFHLFQNFLLAQARYQPRPWQGRLVLFKARDAETAYLHAGRCLGWERTVCAAIQVVPLCGSHASIMREPGLTELAQGLARELAAAGPDPRA